MSDVQIETKQRRYERKYKLHQKAIILAHAKGTSTWLGTLAVEQHRFAFHKGAFSGALALKYGWHLMDYLSLVHVAKQTEYSMH